MDTEFHGSKRKDIFEWSKEMSTYLVCIVIGQYDYIQTKANNRTLIRVFTPFVRYSSKHLLQKLILKPERITLIVGPKRTRPIRSRSFKKKFGIFQSVFWKTVPLTKVGSHCIKQTFSWGNGKLGIDNLQVRMKWYSITS